MRSDEAKKRNIPIVMSCSREYTMFFALTVWSLLESGDRDTKYTVYLLNYDIDAPAQLKLRDIFSGWDNLELYFINITDAVGRLNGGVCLNRGKETFSDLLAPWIFPDCDRLISLDCDLLIRRDVAELYDCDLDGAMLAAVKDVDFIGRYSGGSISYRRYYSGKRRIDEPSGYFQAGVLVMDLAAFRARFEPLELFTLAEENHYKYDEQDLLNQVCKEVKYLDYRWNVIHNNNGHRLRFVIELAPRDICEAYLMSREEPWIIHYAGGDKPWRNPGCDFGREYWQAAENTPMYADLLAISNSGDKHRRRFKLLRRAYHELGRAASKLYIALHSR